MLETTTRYCLSSDELTLKRAYVAYANWYTADANNGIFLLYVNQKNNLDLGIAYNALKWLGITWDNEIYININNSIFEKVSEELLDEQITVEDAHGYVYAPIEQQSFLVENPAKDGKSGKYTVNFKKYVVDMMKGVTHVVTPDERAELFTRRLSQANKVAKCPDFLILDPMPRFPDITIEHLRDRGILPEAIIAYFRYLFANSIELPDVKLSDTFTDNVVQYIKYASIKSFDYRVLMLLQEGCLKQQSQCSDIIHRRIYFRHLPTAYIQPVVEYLEREKLDPPGMPTIEHLIKLIHEYRTVDDFCMYQNLIYEQSYVLDPRVKSWILHNVSPIYEIIEDFRDAIADVPNEQFNSEVIESLLSKLKSKHHNIHGQSIYTMLIPILTCNLKKFDIIEAMAILGRERTLKRLDKVIELSRQDQGQKPKKPNPGKALLKKMGNLITITIGEFPISVDPCEELEIINELANSPPLVSLGPARYVAATVKRLKDKYQIDLEEDDPSVATRYYDAIKKAFEN